MKKTALILGMVAIAFVSCKEKPEAKINPSQLEAAHQRDVKVELLPVALFDKEEYDFGTINEGDVVSTSFKITNTGKTNLIISKAVGSCGCTVPTWPKEPIKPGKSAKIGVKFNSANKQNQQSKTVTLSTNTLKGQEILKIKGFVNPKQEH